MKLPLLDESVRSRRLVPGGNVCLNLSGELSVTNVAVEHVWYLPGVAQSGSAPLDSPRITITNPPVFQELRCARHAHNLVAI